MAKVIETTKVVHSTNDEYRVVLVLFEHGDITFRCPSSFNAKADWMPNPKVIAEIIDKFLNSPYKKTRDEMWKYLKKFVKHDNNQSKLGDY